VNYDIAFPNSPATIPPTGTCIWRLGGNLDAPCCGVPITARKSLVCGWHSIAWMNIDKKKRDELKAAGKPKAKGTE
jgi:hypothetical protein